MHTDVQCVLAAGRYGMGNSREAAKRVIIDLIKAAGGTFAGKVRLHKAFYFAHLLHWMNHKGVLTDYPVVRLPHGPAINDGDDLLTELRDEGKLKIESRPNGPFHETVYRLTHEVRWDPNAERNACIEQAVSFVQNKTAVELSSITHEMSRSWQSCKDGQVLDIYSDLLSEDVFLKTRERDAKLEALVNDTFRLKR